ncbi:MAG: MBL fold metallo-hydrolase [Rubrivivax sp.]|nr:MBL fold metallo-hydrolase [Rubrivivax sp.]
MLRSLVVVSLAASAALLAACGTSANLDATSLLRQSEAAMGGAALKSIQFTTRGSGSTFGQAFESGMAWPRLNYPLLTRLVDYENAALREDFGRSRAEPNGGGAIPLMGLGEQRATTFVRGDLAWNLVGGNPAPAPVARFDRQHDIWTTPHGVLKAALRNAASASRRTEGGQTRSVVSFRQPGVLSASVWIGADGLVERVEALRPHPVLGDVASVTHYSDYRDFGGVKFPMRIRQSQGSFEVLDLAVQEVLPNAPVDITVPDAVRNASERVSAEKVTDGIWFLAGGSHNSVAIEMADHLMVVEAPLHDGRAAAVLAEAKKLAPGKPVRFVVNSHHHFDHSGGLRAAAAEGATLVTSARAQPYFERVLANPNSIAPDLLARSGRQVSILGVSGKRVFADTTRTVEVHEFTGSIHAQGMLMVHLPKERLLIQADAYTPAPAGSAPPAVANANHVNLVDNIERLRLGVDRILPLHGRVVPLADLHAAIGRR